MNENVFLQITCEENKKREEILTYFYNTLIPNDEILRNLGLFINRQNLSRIIFMNELYKKIINVHGVIMEFGVRYGQNLALFESLRGMYEPFNHNRKIIGFDTFNGFKSIDNKDGSHEIIKENSYNVPTDYEKYLEKILDYHESESPIPHIKKYELVKGDATKTIYEYLERNPQTIIAFAYFDFDIYKPTKECLNAIKSHLTKGSIIGFDELNDEVFPGETIALKEVFSLDKYAIRRSPLNPSRAYIIVE